LFFTELDVVQNLSDVSLPNHFVAGQDQGHLEVRASCLGLINNSLNHGEFVEEWHCRDLVDEFGAGCVDLLVKEAACRVPQLNDEDVLLDACINVGS